MPKPINPQDYEESQLSYEEIMDMDAKREAEAIALAEKERLRQKKMRNGAFRGGIV